MSIPAQGKRLYEVYDRKTGRLLAEGSVENCARKLQITETGFRMASKNDNHGKYVIRHVATLRKIYTVYDDHAGIISQGSLTKVAEEMGRAKGTVEYWGRIGSAQGMTITVTEEIEQTAEARENMNPCGLCGKDCRDGSRCKLWRDWWTKVYDQTREDIRKAAGV